MKVSLKIPRLNNYQTGKEKVKSEIVHASSIAANGGGIGMLSFHFSLSVFHFFSAKHP